LGPIREQLKGVAMHENLLELIAEPTRALLSLAGMHVDDSKADRIRAGLLGDASVTLRVAMPADAQPSWHVVADGERIAGRDPSLPIEGRESAFFALVGQVVAGGIRQLDSGQINEMKKTLETRGHLEADIAIRGAFAFSISLFICTVDDVRILLCRLSPEAETLH